MSIYKKVQFIAWEIYTGPSYISLYNDNPDKNIEIAAISYSGVKSTKNHNCMDIHSQCIDIDARVAFTKDAIECAFYQSDNSSDTLKIFMAPEFLFRGFGGVYLHELIYGWPDSSPPEDFDLSIEYSSWDGLFRKLRNIVCDDKYRDWLFVFGSTVSGFFDNNKIKYPLLDMNHLNLIYNTTLIQRGGCNNRTAYHISRKEHICGKDFLEYRFGANIYKKDALIPLNPYSIIPKDILGYSNTKSIFSFPSILNENADEILFGIELGLDHYCASQTKQSDGTLRSIPPGRLKNYNNYVDIQLVPSCGLSLVEDSISLRKQQEVNYKFHSYAFNCDGFMGLEDTSIGAHVQIWDGAENKIDFSNDFKKVPLCLAKVTSEVYIEVYHKDSPKEIRKIKAKELWNSSFFRPRGAGYIRVIDSMPFSYT